MNRELILTFLKGERIKEVELSRSLEDLDDARKEIVSSTLLRAFPDDFKRMGVSPESAHSFVTQSFRAHNGILSLWSNGELVATSGYSLSGDVYFVTNVFTDEDFRGLGVARFMVSESENEINKKGYSESRVWCTEDLSTAYKSMGYDMEKIGHKVSRTHIVDVLRKNLTL